jgi:hypothetical protein
MTSVRAHSRFGALLALLALALQLGLSFGHFHRTVALQSVGTAFHAVTDAAANSHPHPAPDGLSPDDCDICAAIVLAGTAVHAVAPALTVPVAFAPAVVAPSARSLAPVARRVAFNPRAPPTA